MSNEMIKDGRKYLVHCTWVTVEPHWEIVHWGVPSSLSDPYGRENWVRPNGLSLKMENCTFGDFYELDQVVMLLRGSKMAGSDLGKSLNAKA